MGYFADEHLKYMKQWKNFHVVFVITKYAHENAFDT